MHRYLTPNFFFRAEKILIPTIAIALPLILILGLYFALFASPIDYQQKEMVRVMYVHVPSAWMSLGIYSFIAVLSLSNLVWQNRLAYFMAIASAPVGAIFAAITLITGSLWGKPIWGTWWVWDARLTSMLVLFLQYLAYIAVVYSGSNINRAEKPASVIAIIGFVNIPIVKFSVDIWYSLHQPASILKMGGPSIHPAMLTPLFSMFFCFILYFVLILLMRTKVLLNQQKYHKKI